ncbi:MAG: hypothetical protein K0V04_31100 [Deltaproteobacteria bacterium]|nr:hypothetical protein [Deltaproteobacteria bacterium]
MRPWIFVVAASLCACSPASGGFGEGGGQASPGGGQTTGGGALTGGSTGGGSATGAVGTGSGTGGGALDESGTTDAAVDPTTGPGGDVSSGGDSSGGGASSGGGGGESSGGEPPPQSLPELGCREEGNLASLSDAQGADVQFTNDAAELRRLYWLDYGGSRVDFGPLQPGESVGFGSFVTHPWVVTDGNDQCITIFVTVAGQHQISLH